MPRNTLVALRTSLTLLLGLVGEIKHLVVRAPLVRLLPVMSDTNSGRPQQVIGRSDDDTMLGLAK